MGYLYLCFFYVIAVLSFTCVLGISTSVETSSKRQAIEIVIGGIVIGGGNDADAPAPAENPTVCPPTLSPPPPPPPPTPPISPPPPPKSPPPQFLNSLDERVQKVYDVIQKFKALIRSDPLGDPLGITNSWVGRDICHKYKGFFCDYPPDNSSATALAAVDFNSYQLGAPTLEGFIDMLPDLAFFHANTNNFSGNVPMKILKLGYFYELDISNNKFCGSFPSALLAPNNITFLDIRYNSFSGSIPAQIFSQNLEVLFINNNNFMAKLPPNFGDTPVLYLTLANNNLTGPIPPSIGKAKALTEILLLNNQLSGCLPYQIGYLKSLTVFDVGNNRLMGPIPWSFACLSSIEQLNLAGNKFYGAVPEVVCKLNNLQNFSLSDNYFTQVGPICMGLVHRGILDIKKNCVLGLPSQRSPLECARFFSQPQWCPFTKFYNYVPCKSRYSALPSVQKTRLPAKAPSPTYSALNRHG